MELTTEDKLEELAFLQSTSHIGSWYRNLRTNERKWSDEYYSICGLPPGDERLSAETVMKFVHRNDREKSLKAFNFALENQIPYNFEQRIIRPNGAVRYVIARGKVIYDNKGQPLKMFGTIQDITEQKTVEKRSRANEVRNRALLLAIPDIISVLDRQGTYIDVQAPDPDILPATIKQVLGKTIYDVHSEEHCEKIMKAMTDSKQTGKVQLLEFDYRIKGQLRYNEVRILSKGNDKYLSIMRDITQRKTTEIELRESEIRNSAILQALPDAIMVYDKHGNHIYIHALDGFKLMRSKEDYIGANIAEILPRDVSEKIQRTLAKCERTREPQILEYSIRIGDTLKQLESRIVPTDEGNFLAIIRDITEKKATDDMLYLRNRALEAASSGIVITDARLADVPIVYANQAFLATTGYQSSDFIGKNCRFLQGDDRKQEEVKTMASAVKNGKACKVVLRNYRKDRTLFWNEVSLTPIYNNKNVLTHFIGVQNDVTERKKKEFFKSAVIHMMDMITEQEPLEQIGNKIIETIETAIPNCMGSILVLNKERKTLHKLSAPNIPRAYSKAIEGINIGQNMGSCGTAAFSKKEVIVINIAKSPLWKNYKEIALADGLKACWSFPIFSSGQEVLGTFAIYSNTIREPLVTEKNTIQDITRVASVAIEQHIITKALKQSTEKLAAYAEELENKVAERTDELKDIVQKLTESNLGLEDQIQETREAESKVAQSKILLDNISQNFPRGFVAVVDANFKIILVEGEEVEELGFKEFADMHSTLDEVIAVPEEVMAKVKANIQMTFKGDHRSFEISLQDRCYLVNTTPLLNKDNKIKQVLLVHNNISIQKEAEQEILNTLKKEQELSEMKSRFVSTASHEFRTPLSAILTATNLIERQNAPGKEDKRLGYVSRIKSSIENLVAILNDFLSLSKLEEGKVAMQPSFFNIVDFSKSVINEIQGNKKVGQIIEFISNEPHLEVYLDSKLLRHITYNLLSNAIKYSEEDTQIICKIHTIENQIRLEVSDQGMGIPVEDQDQLFQRFHRAKNAVNIQGTGLGLNIVKQYTELMGGTISFKSKLNEGTTFLVVLPLYLKDKH